MMVFNSSVGSCFHTDEGLLSLWEDFRACKTCKSFHSLIPSDDKERTGHDSCTRSTYSGDCCASSITVRVVRFQAPQHTSMKFLWVAFDRRAPRSGLDIGGLEQLSTVKWHDFGKSVTPHTCNVHVVIWDSRCDEILQWLLWQPWFAWDSVMTFLGKTHMQSVKNSVSKPRKPWLPWECVMRLGGPNWSYVSLCVAWGGPMQGVPMTKCTSSQY